MSTILSHPKGKLVEEVGLGEVPEGEASEGQAARLGSTRDTLGAIWSVLWVGDLAEGHLLVGGGLDPELPAAVAGKEAQEGQVARVDFELLLLALGVVGDGDSLDDMGSGGSGDGSGGGVGKPVPLELLDEGPVGVVLLLPGVGDAARRRRARVALEDEAVLLLRRENSLIGKEEGGGDQVGCQILEALRGDDEVGPGERAREGGDSLNPVCGHGCCSEGAVLAALVEGSAGHAQVAGAVVAVEVVVQAVETLGRWVCTHQARQRRWRRRSCWQERGSWAVEDDGVRHPVEERGKLWAVGALELGAAGLGVGALGDDRVAGAWAAVLDGEDLWGEGRR
jgi:hypothetical protein